MKAGLSPEVYGIEDERTMLVTRQGETSVETVGSCHSPDVKLGLYQEPESAPVNGSEVSTMRHGLRAIGVDSDPAGHLSNGGRYYMDPSGPEYATAEHRSAEGAVHASFIGDVLHGLACQALIDDSESNVIAVQNNRANVDHAGTSRGVHQNTVTTLAELDEGEIQVLAMLNVAKAALVGSGGLLVDGDGQTHFHHSPRLSVTNSLWAKYSNYQDRPLVRVPLKEDVGGLNRVETITSDALSFGYPMKMSQLFTKAGLWLLEMGKADQLPVLNDSIAAAHAVGRYGYNCEIEIRMPTGSVRSIRPLQLVSAVTKYMGGVDEKFHVMNEKTRLAIADFGEMARMVDENPLNGFGQVESITRETLMHERLTRRFNRVDLNSEQACRFDYWWSETKKGFAKHLREAKGYGWRGFEEGYNPKAYAQRLVAPPADTRAAIRGAFIAEIKGRRAVDWHQLVSRSGSVADLHPLQCDPRTVRWQPRRR